MSLNEFIDYLSENGSNIYNVKSIVNTINNIDNINYKYSIYCGRTENYYMAIESVKTKWWSAKLYFNYVDNKNNIILLSIHIKDKNSTNIISFNKEMIK